MTTLLLIDGENFKGKIKAIFQDAGMPAPVWHQYDFKALLDTVLAGIGSPKVRFYFARLREHGESKEKSRQLIDEQRKMKNHLELQGYEVVLSGRVRGRLEKVGWRKEVLVFKEKGVDVRIAVDMVSLACDKLADTVILGSSDSDLQPAISEVRKRGAICIYLGFENLPNKGMTYTTNRTILIRNAEVLACEKRLDLRKAA